VGLVAVRDDNVWEDVNAVSEVVGDCDGRREIEIRVCSVVMELASDAYVWIGEGRRERKVWVKWEDGWTEGGTHTKCKSDDCSYR
jgi:hypothetical protein